MNPIRNFIMITTATIALAACSSDKDTEAKDGDSKKESTNTTETGNRFYDSAVKKIQTGPPAVSAEQAKAIVDFMTKDGKIGLGEINSLDFNDPTKNAGYLKAALEAARAASSQ